MSTIDKFDAVMDWCMEGSAPVVALKIFGGASVIIAAMTAPFFYVANQNERSYRNTFDALDRSQTVIFQSPEQCVAKGYNATSCKTSYDSAKSWAGKLGTEISYESSSNCAQAHGTNNCSPITTTVSSFIMSGKIMVPITTTTTSYKPPVIAWQAAANDLGNAVPLYPTTASKMGIRFDRKQFALGE